MNNKKLAAAAEGARLLTQFGATIEAIEAHSFPRLKVATIKDDGETYQGLRCPHCRVDVNGGEELACVELSLRKTRADVMEDIEIIDGSGPNFEVDENTHFSTLYFICLSCNGGVRLPEGWKKRS